MKNQSIFLLLSIIVISTPSPLQTWISPLILDAAQGNLRYNDEEYGTGAGKSIFTVGSTISSFFGALGLSNIALAGLTFAGWRFHRRLVRIENTGNNTNKIVTALYKEFNEFARKTGSTLSAHTEKLNRIIETGKITSRNVAEIKTDTSLLREGTEGIKQSLEVLVEQSKNNLTKSDIEEILKKYLSK